MKRINGWWLTILLLLVMPALALTSVELLQRHRYALLVSDLDAGLIDLVEKERLSTAENGDACLAEGRVETGHLTFTSSAYETHPRIHYWALGFHSNEKPFRAGEPIRLSLFRSWLEPPTATVSWMIDLHPSLKSMTVSLLQAHGLRYTVHEMVGGV